MNITIKFILLTVFLMLFGCGQTSSHTQKQSSSLAVSTVSAGATHTVFLRSDGTVWTAGLNSNGQHGDGTLASNIFSKALVEDIRNISAGYYHTVALKKDGTVVSWGANDNSQVGGSTSTAVARPIQVTGLRDIIAVSAGYAHNAALRSDGTVWTWGDNRFGQLGDGTQSPRSIPVQVAGLTGVKALSSGMYHSLALKEDGTVWSWGLNKNGQLGDGTVIKKNIPVQVNGINDVIDISAGFGHSIALKSDGTILVWGSNMFGQLGDGTLADKLIPVSLTKLSGVTAVEANYFNSAALKSDGTLWTWGLNTNGQLGNGTHTDSSFPVQVKNLSEIKAVSAGSHHVVTLGKDGRVWAWGANSDRQLLNVEPGAGSSIARQVESINNVKTDPLSLPPKTLIAIPNSTLQTIISWEPVVGASYYNIYYSYKPNATPANSMKIFKVLKPQYIHTNLDPNSSYYYRVSAVNSLGIESIASDEVAVKMNSVRGTTNNNGYYSSYNNHDPNSCLSKENIALKFKHITTNDIALLRQGVMELYNNCGEVFFSTLPFALDYYGRMFVLSTFISHNLAPYGPNGDGYYTQWPTMNCDDYASLALILFWSVTRFDGNYKGKNAFWGFDHPSIGSHAQLFYQSDSYILLTDPTIGIAAPISNSDLMAGVPITENMIARFYSYHNLAIQPAYMEVFFDRVIDKLLSGEYASSTTLYYYENFIDNVQQNFYGNYY